MRLDLSGPITSLASLELEALERRIAGAAPGTPVILDAAGATAIDAAGVEMLVDLVTTMKRRGLAVALTGLRADLREKAIAADQGGVLASVLADTEEEVRAVLAGPDPVSTRKRLAVGVDRYRRDHLPRYADLFTRLADKQTPHTLFVTCSDSRINPALITSSDPGELFIVRNVGNMVPRYSASDPPPAGGAIEYAVGVLGVQAIILCAHSRCGAINALTHPHQVPESLTCLQAWLVATEARAMVDNLPSDVAEDETARLNALLQLDHVRGYPVVKAPLEAGTLRLYAWFFDVATGEIEEYSQAEKRWRKLGAEEMHNAAAASVGREPG